MNLDQAITTIETALNLAAQRGVFNLKDSAIVNEALNVLLPMKTQPTEEMVVDK